MCARAVVGGGNVVLSYRDLCRVLCCANYRLVAGSGREGLHDILDVPSRHNPGVECVRFISDSRRARESPSATPSDDRAARGQGEGQIRWSPWPLSAGILAWDELKAQPSVFSVQI